MYETPATVTVTYGLSNMVDYQTVSTCSWTQEDTDALTTHMRGLWSTFEAVVSLTVNTECGTLPASESSSSSSSSIDESRRRRRTVLQTTNSPLGVDVVFTSQNQQDMNDIASYVGTSSNGILSNQMTASINTIDEFSGSFASVDQDATPSASVTAALVMPSNDPNAISTLKASVDAVFEPDSASREALQTQVRSILNDNTAALPLVNVTRKDMIVIPEPSTDPGSGGGSTPSSTGSPGSPPPVYVQPLGVSYGGRSKKLKTGVIVGIVFGCSGAALLLALMGLHNSSLLSKLAIERRYMMNFYGKTVSHSNPPPPVPKSPTMSYMNGRFVRQDSGAGMYDGQPEGGGPGGAQDYAGGPGAGLYPNGGGDPYMAGMAGGGGGSGGDFYEQTDYQYDNPYYATHDSQYGAMYGDDGSGAYAPDPHMSIPMMAMGGMYTTSDYGGSSVNGAGMPYSSTSSDGSEQVYRDTSFNRARASTAYGEDLLSRAATAAADQEAAAAAAAGGGGGGAPPSSSEPGGGGGRNRASTEYGASLLNSAAAAAAYQEQLGTIAEDGGSEHAPSGFTPDHSAENLSRFRTRASTLYGVAAMQRAAETAASEEGGGGEAYTDDMHMYDDYPQHYN